LVHTKGFRVGIVAVEMIADGLLTSATLVNVPRRVRFCVISAKKRSTRFSQEALVGVKCRWQRCLASQRFTAGVRPVVVEDEVDIEMPLHTLVDALEEPDDLFRTVMGMALADDKARLHVERRTASWCRCACNRRSSSPPRPFLKGGPGWVRSSA
jgi:hypothetical protein